MASGSPQDPPRHDHGEDLIFRRGKLRRRDDPALDLLRDALAHLDDLPRVRRILFELTRLYDPVTNGPIVDLAFTRRVVELIQAGDPEAARAVLTQRVTAYVPPPPGPR